MLAQLRFLKANYLGYRNIQIDHYVDLPQNANVIDQVANSQYKNVAARDTTSD